jgi:dynactin complex subunit
LDDKKGKNNGSINGITYFDCKPEFGLFVRPKQVQLLNEKGEIISPLKSSLRSHSSSFNESQSSVSQLLEQEIKAFKETKAEFNRKELFLALLKLKLTNSMAILNRQLEIVEELQGCVFVDCFLLL